MDVVEIYSATDFKIWEKFREGNWKAFGIIYERHIQMLANYGKRMSPDEDLVKDAIQDMFMDLWRNKENLSPTDSIKFYLIKALRRNLVKKIVTSKKFVVQDASERSSQPGEFELSHELSLIELEIEKEKLAQLNESLNALPSRQKEALFLRFYSGLNYDEISQILDINLQSAYNMVFRGLETLRKTMKYTFTAIIPMLVHAFCS